jgi:hypothetical protein
LHARATEHYAAWLADLLTEIESDPDDITRLRLIDGLERVLGG